MASRDLTAAMKDALVAKTTSPILLYEGNFVGLILRLWSGVGNLVWDGQTYLGNGWFRGYEGIEENEDLGSTGMDITLAGVPLTLISTLLGSSQQGASGKLWLGFLDANDAVIADPYLMFNGRLDVPTIDDKVDGPILQISYESELIEGDRSKEFRYTPEGQRIFNANDKGFDYVAQIAAGWKGQWGATAKQIKKKDERSKSKKNKGKDRK